MMVAMLKFCPSGNVRLPKKVFRQKFFWTMFFLTVNNVFFLKNKTIKDGGVASQQS